MPPSTTELPPPAASSIWPWIKGLAAALVAVAWAVASHMAAGQSEPSGWGAALALAPVVTALVLGLWSLPARWLGLTGLALMAALLVGAWPWLTARVPLLFFLDQTGVYILMAVVFGRTLRGPGESLVTQMARLVHGGVLSARQLVYTRGVTIAWSVFFLVMALVSVALFLWAPTPVWSTFAYLLADFIDLGFAEFGHGPVTGKAADVANEVLEQLAAVGRVHDFGVELHRIDALLIVCDYREGRAGAGGDRTEAGGELRHLVAVAHPHLMRLALVPEAVE